MRLSRLIGPGAGLKINSTKIDNAHLVNSLSSAMILKHESFIFTFLKTSGGSSDLVVNGSATAVDFEYTPPSGYDFLVKDVNFLIRDASVGDNKFGGQTVLSNGCLFRMVDADGVELLDFTGGDQIKRNADFYLLAGAEAKTNNNVHVKWNIASTGAALAIENGERLQFKVQDDLTALTEFKIAVQGLLWPSPIVLQGES